VKDEIPEESNVTEQTLAYQINLETLDTASAVALADSHNSR
jgi:hypothetical protein